MQLNPNCAWAWNRFGWLNGYVDKPRESIEYFEKAIRLSPLDPMNLNCFVGIGSAHFLEQHHDDAIRWMEKALAAHPGACWIYRQLIPAHVSAGRIEDAKRALSSLVHEYPGTACEKIRAVMLYSAPVNAAHLRRPRAGGTTQLLKVALSYLRLGQS